MRNNVFIKVQWLLILIGTLFLFPNIMYAEVENHKFFFQEEQKK